MLEMYSPILFLFVLIILSRVVAAIMAQSAAGRKPPSTEEETQFRRPMMSEEIQRRIEKAEDPFRGQMQHNPAPESAEEGSLMEMIRRASEDRAVYSGGDKSMSFGDRLEKEIQMRQHRRKVAGYRR